MWIGKRESNFNCDTLYFFFLFVSQIEWKLTDRASMDLWTFSSFSHFVWFFSLSALSIECIELKVDSNEIEKKQLRTDGPINRVITIATNNPGTIVCGRWSVDYRFVGWFLNACRSYKKTTLGTSQMYITAEYFAIHFGFELGQFVSSFENTPNQHGWHRGAFKWCTIMYLG